MRGIVRDVSTRTVGAVLGAALIGGLVSLGVGPEEWLTWAFGNVLTLARISLVGLALALIALWYRPALRRRWKAFADEEKRPLQIETTINTVDLAGLTSIAQVRVRNTGGEMLEQCIAKITGFSGGSRTSPPIPFALRTANQIPAERTGSFLMRPGDEKTIPIVWRENKTGDIWLVHQDGSRHELLGPGLTITVGVYSEKTLHTSAELHLEYIKKTRRFGVRLAGQVGPVKRGKYGGFVAPVDQKKKPNPKRR